MKTLFKDIKISSKPTLIKDSKLFSYIDSDFKNLTDKEKVWNKETTLEVLEMEKDGTFKDFFTDPDKMVMTQGEILSFVQNHKDKLRTDGYATFFLFKVEDKFFVALVRLYSGGGLEVYVRPFSDGDVWLTESLHRVVVPQLTPATA